MAELKTRKINLSVKDFIQSLKDQQKIEDSLKLVQLFEEVTGEKATMWGSSIIGFGSYHYKSERSRQEGDWPLTGFSPRKQNMTIYIMPGFDTFKKEIDQIGKVKTSVSCIYFKKLSDLDLVILKKIIKDSVKIMKDRYGVKAVE